MLAYLADLAHDPPGAVQYTPTGIGYLAAAAFAKLGDRVEIKLFKSPGKFLDAIDFRRPDLVGLTNYTWNHALGVCAGEYVRHKYPDLPVVMGGPNIRTDEQGIESFLRQNPYVDQYCMYAGETSFVQMVELLCSRPQHERTSRELRDIKVDGAYALCEDRLVGNSNYHMPQDLDEIPSPFVGGWMDEFLEQGFIPIFETNRGCPFSCTFCVWGISALNKVRRFSMPRVASELSYVAGSAFKTPILCFGDANFGILPRDVEIAQFIRDLYDEHKSFSSVQFYWSKTLKPHMVEMGRILGHLTQTYIAFQSLDPVVLGNIKRKNISTDELLGLIQSLKAFTNSTQTDLLLGLPGETYRSHLESLDTALSYGIDLIHGGEIRMLPGAEMDTPESRKQFGIKTKYRLFEGGQGVYRGRFVYEMEEVVRETDSMTEEEMLELRVLRAIFYGCVTLGELLPVVAYLKSRGLSVTELCQRILTEGRQDPAFAEHLEWLRARSEEEWFETPEDLDRFFSDEQNREAVMSDGAFVKLNIGFLARVYLDSAGYESYYGVVTRALRQMIPRSDRALVQELIQLCRIRNYLIQCLQAMPHRSASLAAAVSRDAAGCLVTGGFLPPDDSCLEDGQLVLTVNPTTAQLCERFVDDHRDDMTILRLSQTMLLHAGRFMMKPRRLSTGDKAVAETATVGGDDAAAMRVTFPVSLSPRA